MGFFAAEKTFPIPNKDITSWIFDDPAYDGDEPVSYRNIFQRLPI